MDDTPPHRMVSPRPETENSGYRETDSRRGDLPFKSPPSPHSRESSQSRNVSTNKSGDFPESSETRSDVETYASTAKWTTEIMPGGGGVQQDGTAGAVSKESSTIEEEQACRYVDETEQETGGNPEGLASRSISRYRTKATICAKASTHTGISGCTSGVGTNADDIASSRMDDPERAQQKVSVAEHSSTECTEDSEIKSGSPMTNVEAVDAASSRVGDPSNKPVATAESRAKERESSEHGRCPIGSRYISAQPRCMTLEALPEGVEAPVPYTAVAQRLLQILFRERRKTAQTIARETSGETHDTMQEILAELRAPANRTIRECEQELVSSAAGTSQCDAERQAGTDTPVSQNDQSETSPSETEALDPGPGKPLECLINVPKESEHMASDSASKTSLEYKLSSPATVRHLGHETESPISETFSRDRWNEPPKPSTTISSNAPDLCSQITAKPPDYRQGQSSRSYIYPALHVFKKPSMSPLNLWPRKKCLIQSLTSAFSVVRKIAFEEQPPPLLEEATPSKELRDDSTEPAVKAEPSAPRKMPPRSATSAEQKKAPVSLQCLGKRSLSSESESTDEEIAGRPPTSRRHAEESRRAGESQDTSDESIPSPPVQTEYFFRAVELAPASATSEMKVVRPVVLRAPITAQTTAFKFVLGPTSVSEQAELAVGKLTESTSDRGTVTTGDNCSSDVDIISTSSTLRDAKHQLERDRTSPAYESDSLNTTDDERGGANEPSGDESDITVGALEQFFSVQNELWCTSSETSSDSSETSVNGRGGTVDGSGDTTSAVDPDSSNTTDDKESSRAASDAARFGAGCTSQHSCSYVGDAGTGGAIANTGSRRQQNHRFIKCRRRGRP
ncbi:hypothetical protein HPB50_007903 [Hyalomma asiaticum]|uniref:Uncharacterized protein n=1 Tax=Hyalomma asiaticum TaxID=266040 RepID=A0ACB7TKG0_HYAAI|nr:hypothetical protein HPB50_007903 [Hyalomma asiaticum]